MLKKIFQKIHRKILFEIFIDTLIRLSSIFFIIFSAHIFLNNLFPKENLFFIFISIFIFIFSFKDLILNSERKSVEFFNGINRELKNVPLVLFENLENGEKIFTKSLKEEFIGINLKGKNFYRKDFREKNLRFLFVSVIIFLSIVTFYPLLLFNTLNLTEKRVVLKNFENDFKILSFNYGSISGNIFVKRDDGKIVKYREGKDYSLNSYIFFKGPKVESNMLSLKLIKGFLIDSILTEVIPPEYILLKGFTLKGKFLDILEYSSFISKIFFNDKTKYEFQLKRVLKDTTLYFGKGNIKDSIKVNILKDKQPFVKIVVVENGLGFKDEVNIPVICRDDFGNDSIYLHFQSESDSFFLSYKIFGKDTILIFNLNLEKIRERYKRLYFVLKDNNPYRRQTTSSQVIDLIKGESIYSFIDSTYLKGDFSKDIDSYSQKVMEILNELEKEKRMENVNKFKEELKGLNESFEKVKEELKNISEYKLPENIYKKMAELKSELDRLDKKMIENLSSLLNKDLEIIPEKEKKSIVDKLIRESNDIEKDLEKLKNVLKDLNRIFSLNRLNEELKKLIETEKNIIEDKDLKKQVEVSEKLEGLKNETIKNEDLKEYEEELSDIAKISKESEKDFSKIKDVKDKLENLKSKVEKNLEKMSGKSERYNKEIVISTLLFIDQIIDSTQNLQLVSNLYQSIIDYTGEDVTSPLTILLKTAQRIAKQNGNNLLPLKEQNVMIINFLLKDEPQGEGASSLERIAEQLSSMSKEQQYISQMLWEMFGKGEMKKNILEMLGSMERELAEKMKRLGEQSAKDVGGTLSELSDSLKDVAKDLKDGKIDGEVLKKQERILKRMLNITKSIYKKRIDEKRESTTGKDYEIPVRIIQPKDYGYKKYLQLKKRYEDVEKFKRKEWIPIIKLYLQEIMNE
ncbi:MAG: hypothetical protein QME48_01935 [bacterium]|uniref:Ras-GAP domain-containing protein n=2 Tax=Bacteria candidate phyla TaxID=1783234 RepID=A0A101I209_UNCT6|nr:MAG: Uncharacterized protein XD76_0908 [candidate division TA06 bacterium 32_111]KUK87185.1 MAG: Uncharacterized protein XE03_0981 [candidate division TA06 bacterium 34_109]MDI6699976.1 hypothetical protein [bacterium]HAF07674.1 hypothetical protein [candidate division WOR-3 bacterium]HCP17052.1 hypothetical protein [candidate division WOR-3 bacterium]